MSILSRATARVLFSAYSKLSRLYPEMLHDIFLCNDYNSPESYRSLVLVYSVLKADVEEKVGEQNIVLFRIEHKME
jgi:hypothetical protein